MGGLGKPGAEALSLALKNNRTLLELDISYNRIPMEGAHSIAAGLKVNDVLKRLKVSKNSILIMLFYAVKYKFVSKNKTTKI